VIRFVDGGYSAETAEVGFTSRNSEFALRAEVGPTSASFAWPELAEVRETSAPEPSLGKADLRLHLLYVL
jgi:hypothetical protein